MAWATFALPRGSASKPYVYHLGDLWAALSFQVLMWFGSETWAGAPSSVISAVTSYAQSPPAQTCGERPASPHLHARSLLLGQAHRVAAVGTQHRAQRAHATAAAVTEELSQAFAVLRAAPAASPVGLDRRPRRRRAGCPALHLQWQPRPSLAV